MKKNYFFIVIFALAIFGSVNGQQIKRNIVANANFEDGLKHWRSYDANGRVAFSTETEDPLSGEKSAKVLVKYSALTLWDASLKYFFPMTSGVKYKISFQAKASEDANIGIELTFNRAPWTLLKYESTSISDFTPVDVAGNAARSGLDDNDLCGTFPITTETQEYWIVTDGSNITDWNYSLAFCFGRTEPGTTVWIDNVRIEYAEEGDWDGNLFPYGDFEEGIAPLLWQGDNEVQNFRIEKNSARTDTWEVSEEDPISGDKSLVINRNSGNGNFWDFVFLFQFWTIEGVRTQTFFDIKSTNEGMISTRLASEPWDRPVNGDHLVNDVIVTAEVQRVELSPDSKVGGNNTATGNYAFDPHWLGRMKVFTSFTEGANQIPADSKIWIDNIVVNEYNLKTQSFDIVNAPATLKIGESQQLSIANVYPTHAPAHVTYSVDDANIATIDAETGILTGVAQGTVNITVKSDDDNAEETVAVNITSATGTEATFISTVYLYPTQVNRGNAIEIRGIDNSVSFEVFNMSGQSMQKGLSKIIDTSNLVKGSYLVKIADDSNTTKRFIVK